MEVSIPQDFKKIKPQIEKQINYTFTHSHFLFRSLCHRSWCVEKSKEDRTYLSYERLEFLGDAILNLFVKEFLFEKFPQKDEGELTKYTKFFVNGDFLAKKAKKLHLNQHIYLTDSEKKNGGRNRSSILSDVYEAVIGAIYLDSNYPATKKFLTQHHMKSYKTVISSSQCRNYKGELINYLRDRGISPKFKVCKKKGPDHNKKFFIKIFVECKVEGKAWASSVKRAEQKASAQALESLREEK